MATHSGTLAWKIPWTEEVKCQFLSHVLLFVTPWTVACQAPLSMEFSRQEYWSGLLFPPPGDLPNPGMESIFPALQADSLLFEPLGKPIHICLCQSLSYVLLFATPWTVAHQTPLSMGFSRQEYWSGLQFPPPGYIHIYTHKNTYICVCVYIFIFRSLSVVGYYMVLNIAPRATSSSILLQQPYLAIITCPAELSLAFTFLEILLIPGIQTGFPPCVSLQPFQDYICLLVWASLMAQMVILQCRRLRFNPWVWKMPCGREWLPTPVFLLGEFHGQRSVVSFSPWGLQRIGHD